LAWFKDAHGLLQNRAMHVLSIAYPAIHDVGLGNPYDYVSQLFEKFHKLVPVYEAIVSFALASYPNVVASPRKTFVPIVAAKNFALLLPHKSGLILSLVLPEDYTATERLILSQKPIAGGERNKFHVLLNNLEEFDDEIKGYMRSAYELNK
jgi:Domain of unknown function (DUF5655)